MRHRVFRQPADRGVTPRTILVRSRRTRAISHRASLVSGALRTLVRREQTGTEIDIAHAVPVYRSTSDSQFQTIKAFYRYDRTQLDDKVIETIETADWLREKIEYRGGNDEKAVAYLYLPKNTKPPYQVIQYLPAGDVYGGFTTLPVHVETFAASQIKAVRGSRGRTKRLYRARISRRLQTGTRKVGTISGQFGPECTGSSSRPRLSRDATGYRQGSYSILGM